MCSERKRALLDFKRHVTRHNSPLSHQSVQFLQKDNPMFIKQIARVVGVCALLSAMCAHAQFAKPEDAIKYRKATMTIINTHFSRIAAMAQGKIPFDAKVAQDNEEVFATVSKLPWSAFGEGTDKGDTKAKAEIWSDQAKFKAAQDKFLAESLKLNAAAKTGKLDDLNVAFKGVGAACKGCHDGFKDK
jgi:cytochrome c556